MGSQKARFLYFGIYAASRLNFVTIKIFKIIIIVKIIIYIYIYIYI